MKTLKALAVAVVVLMATAAVAYGADQIRDRGTVPQHDQSPDKIQLQKKLKDGSCQDTVATAAASVQVKTDDDLADDATPTQARDRDRLQDGSCGDCDGAGDCTQTQAHTQTQSQTQTQTHDGNAWDDGDAGHEGEGGQGDGGQGDGGCGGSENGGH